MVGVGERDARTTISHVLQSPGLAMRHKLGLARKIKWVVWKNGMQLEVVAAGF